MLAKFNSDGYLFKKCNALLKRAVNTSHVRYKNGDDYLICLESIAKDFYREDEEYIKIFVNAKSSGTYFTDFIVSLRINKNILVKTLDDLKKSFFNIVDAIEDDTCLLNIEEVNAGTFVLEEI